MDAQTTSSFKHEVIEEIRKSITNYHKDNFDYNRFKIQSISLANKVKKLIRTVLPNSVISANETTRYLENTVLIFAEYGERLQKLYDILSDDYSKRMLVQLITYRILGKVKVKLSTNTTDYWLKYKAIEKLKNEKEQLDIKFNNWHLNMYDIQSLGMPIKLYIRPSGVLHEFILEQYKYKDKVMAEKGDVVFDAGACWGDTALYFANRVGSEGKVYSFEFIPGNCSIFQQNLNLNDGLKNCIELITNPLWEKEGLKIYFTDNGPGSQVSFQPFVGYQGVGETLTIDSIVQSKNLTKLDFIKMDIEGAEPNALNGALDTIKALKPKLAIASYHSLDDFVNIPLWINDLNLGYELYLDHFTIHWEETIIFAKVKDK
jgi:FkbM family methyltransferase